MICKLNVLYEVTIAELEMIALSGSDMKIGFLNIYKFWKSLLSSFSPCSFFIINKAKRTSRIMLGVFLFLAVYNTIFTFLYFVFSILIKIMKDWINHEERTVVS